jgi:hypothetical protein
MEKLPYGIIYEIMYFLNNEDILKMIRVNKKINKLMDSKSFKEEILYRDHPLVFNLLDNLCEYCNFKPVLLSDCYKEFIFCKHC